MKKVAGSLKMAQAQYNELESFSKFSSDVDPVTAMTLDKGRKNNRLLIQPQYSPMPVAEQVAILYCGVNGLMRDIDIDSVPAFQDKFLETLRLTHKADVLEPLAEGKIDNNITALLTEIAAETVKEINA